MKLAFHLTIVALVWCGPAESAFAHPCGHHNNEHGCVACDHGGPAWRQLNRQSGYSSANLKTVSGKILEIVYLPGDGPDTGMVDLRIQTGAGPGLVRLAPSGFLRQGGLRLQEGDSVTVKVFTVGAMTGEIMVATEVQGKGAQMRLRGPSGEPLW